MNIQFSKIHLPQLPKINANNLIELAERNSVLQLYLPEGVKNSKTNHRADITEIIRDIENNRDDNITTLEWIYCLHNKEHWDRQNQNRSKTTSEAIWKIAEQNDWLKQNLFWNLSLEHYGTGWLTPSLVKTFDRFSATNQLDEEKVEIIKIISNLEPAAELTTFCRNKLITPQELFYQYQLPAEESIIDATSAYIIDEFLLFYEPNEHHLTWLLDCLQAMKAAERSKAVEQLLIEVEPQVAARHVELINWLRQNYGSAVTNSRWHELLKK